MNINWVVLSKLSLGYQVHWVQTGHWFMGVWSETLLQISSWWLWWGIPSNRSTATLFVSCQQFVETIRLRKFDFENDILVSSRANCTCSYILYYSLRIFRNVMSTQPTHSMRRWNRSISLKMPQSGQLKVSPRQIFQAWRNHFFLMSSITLMRT